jgi:competence protein ComEC
MPVFTFLVMPAGAVALLLMPLGLDGPPLAVMGWGIEILFAIAERVADLPGAIRPVTAAPGWVLPIYAAGFVLAWFGRSALRLCGVGLGLMALAGWVAAPAPAIFISETGVIAFETEPGSGDWRATERRRDRFAVRVFLEQRGSARQPGRADLACDELGWSGTAAGLRYSVLTLAEDWQEDCDRAALIVLGIDLPAWWQRHCDARLLDAADLARSGAALVWVRDGRIVRMRRVDAHPQARPWQRDR